jgi:hypothetical protein
VFARSLVRRASVQKATDGKRRPKKRKICGSSERSHSVSLKSEKKAILDFKAKNTKNLEENTKKG